MADANKLQAILLHHRGFEAVVGEDVPKPEVLYELSTRQVLLAGALGNRALYIFGSVMAVIQFEGSRQFLSPVADYIRHLDPMMSILVSALTFVGLVFAGWLLSIIISATRFYNFRIERHDRGLLLTHGLITQFKTIVPVGRIQDVRIVEPILFRLLGYCEIYADTAGSFDAKDAASANKICPILHENDASRIGKLLMPEFEFEHLYWNQVSKRTIARHFGRHMVLYTILFSWPLAHWLGWFGLLAVPPLLVYSWLTGVISYRYVGYAWTDDIIVSRTGIFRKKAIIIPFDRIQHYSINSSLVQRWLGLATMTAVNGASGGHPIHVADIDIEAAEKLRKTIGLSIEKHLGSRRGGL